MLASKFKQFRRDSKILESNILELRRSTQKIPEISKNSNVANSASRISAIDESQSKMQNNTSKRLSLNVPNQFFLFNSTKRKSEMTIDKSRDSETPSANEHKSRINQ